MSLTYSLYAARSVCDEPRDQRKAAADQTPPVRQELIPGEVERQPQVHMVPRRLLLAIVAHPGGGVKTA